MRNVNKDFAKIPTALQTQFYNNKELHAKLLDDKTSHTFNNRIYNEATISELRNLYHNKCAFCECKFVEREKGKWKHAFCGKATVEHYRPKSYYYWLGYEWSNLFLTCEVCNQGKADNFDLVSNDKRKKQTLPLIENKIDFSKCKADCAELLAEEPCFLHPEIDKAEDFFTFDRTGNIVPKAHLEAKNKKRAEYTRDKTKLNRWELVDARKRIIDTFYVDFLNALKDILAKYKSEEIEDRLLETVFFRHFEKMLISQQPESEYSLLGDCLLHQFDDYFLKPLAADISEDVSKLLEYSFSLFLENET